MTKKGLSASLADKLKLAGMMSEGAAKDAAQSKQRAEQEARAKGYEEGRRAGTVEGVSAYWMSAAPRGESLGEVLAWGTGWFDELVAAGHGELLARHHVTRPEACHAPVREAELSALEEEVGYRWPPSLRRMFAEQGGVRWSSEGTLAAGEILAQVQPLREVIARFARPLEELAPYQGELQLLPLACVDGNFDFLLRNVRGADDESPIYFVHHDEAHLYGGAPSLAAWLAAKIEVEIDRFVDRAKRR
jgi:hypothetical protein